MRSKRKEESVQLTPVQRTVNLGNCLCSECVLRCAGFNLESDARAVSEDETIMVSENLDQRVKSLGPKVARDKKEKSSDEPIRGFDIGLIGHIGTLPVLCRGP